jgi:hypothetical protein
MENIPAYVQTYYNDAIEHAAIMNITTAQYQKRWIRHYAPRQDALQGQRYDNEFLEQPDQEINRIFIRYLLRCEPADLNVMSINDP